MSLLDVATCGDCGARFTAPAGNGCTLKRWHNRPGPESASEPGMSGRVTHLEVIKAFFTNERSTVVTLVSQKTGTRFSFKIKRKEPAENGHADRVWYVDVLTGSNNESDYAPLAVLTEKVTETGPRLAYFHARKARISKEAPSAVALRWATEHLVFKPSEKALAQVEIWHEGKCAACGRKLSTPESIAFGMGPECRERLGG